MSEKEAVLERMGQVRNVADRGEIHKPAVRLLRKKERNEREDELRRIDQQLAAPAWAASAMTAEGRAALSRRKRQLEKELKDWSPRTDISAETRDALSQRAKQLESDIAQGMPTSEVMRRNPVGAVDKHRGWEKRNKDKVLEWKNIQVQLNPDSDEIDLANIERIRPSQTFTGGPSTFMVDAQIPGTFAMTPQAKENWPLPDPETTALAQAKKHSMSPEQRKEVGRRLAAGRKAKKDKRKIDLQI